MSATVGQQNLDETGVVVDELRARAIPDAIAHLRAGQPGRAHWVMARLLREQLREAGIGRLQLGDDRLLTRAERRRP